MPSPRREVLRPTRDLQSQRTALKQYEHYHDFEFQIIWTSVSDKKLSPSQNSHSRHEATHERQRARGKSLPTIAFEDELFCDGKVMPLRPPNRLHFGNRIRNPSADASTPISPYSAGRLLLQRRKIWNDDFDPFTAALEKVKEEDRDRNQVSNRQRARSLSPFRVFKLRSSGKMSPGQDQGQRTPDKDIKTDHVWNPVNAEISKKRVLKRLFSFASLSSSSSCLRPQVYHLLHPQREKPTRRR